MHRVPGLTRQQETRGGGVCVLLVGSGRGGEETAAQAEPLLKNRIERQIWRQLMTIDVFLGRKMSKSGKLSWSLGVIHQSMLEHLVRTIKNEIGVKN